MSLTTKMFFGTINAIISPKISIKGFRVYSTSTTTGKMLKPRFINSVDEVASFVKDKLIKTLKEDKMLSPLKLVGLLANQDPESEKYALSTGENCQELGIDFELVKVEKKDLKDKILTTNDDPNVHGMLVYYPVFGPSDQDKDSMIQNCIVPEKDVEGLCDQFVNKLYNNVQYFDQLRKFENILPCTPLGILKILDFYQLPVRGKITTIINRSDIVGLPLAFMIAHNGGIVYSVDISNILYLKKEFGQSKCLVSKSTLKLNTILSMSDIVISGVPSSDYKIPTASLKDRLIAINFSSYPNFYEDTISTKASIYLNAVGKITTLMLQSNLIQLRKYQLALAESKIS